MAAERLTAAIALWQITKGRHQPKNRPSNAKSASEIPHLTQPRGTATALAWTLQGRQNQRHEYQGLQRLSTSAP